MLPSPVGASPQPCRGSEAGLSFCSGDSGPEGRDGRCVHFPPESPGTGVCQRPACTFLLCSVTVCSTEVCYHGNGSTMVLRPGGRAGIQARQFTQLHARWTPRPGFRHRQHLARNRRPGATPLREETGAGTRPGSRHCPGRRGAKRTRPPAGLREPHAYGSPAPCVPFEDGMTPRKWRDSFFLFLPEAPGRSPWWGLQGP